MNSRIALLSAFALASPFLPAFLPAAAAHPAKSGAEMAVLKSKSQNVEAHIAALHKDLQITTAEEGQWTAFAQVMRENASAMDAAFSQRGAAMQTMTAVQDMQSYAEVARIQSDNMQKLSAAFQTLYAGFPAAQQKLADSVFRPPVARK